MATPSNTQRLFLALYSRISSDSAQGTIQDVEDPIQVGCMQGKQLTCYISTSTPPSYNSFINPVNHLGNSQSYFSITLLKWFLFSYKQALIKCLTISELGTCKASLLPAFYHSDPCLHFLKWYILSSNSSSENCIESMWLSHRHSMKFLKTYYIIQGNIWCGVTPDKNFN